MTHFDNLEKSARTVNVLAAALMAISWVGALVCFIYPRIQIGLSPAMLFLAGCIIGVLGEAASKTMAALAEHMRDTKAVRECMERLMGRIEKR